MKIRSTGLGKTELECKIDKLEPVGDYLVLAIDTVAPVKWKVRAALSYRDLWGMVFMALKMRTLLFILNVFRAFSEEKPISDY